MAIALHHSAQPGTDHHLHGLGAVAEWVSEHIHRVMEIVAIWQQRLDSRHQLAQLNDRELQDIGLTRSDVWQEVSKPFWRA